LEIRLAATILLYPSANGCVCHLFTRRVPRGNGLIQSGSRWVGRKDETNRQDTKRCPHPYQLEKPKKRDLRTSYHAAEIAILAMHLHNTINEGTNTVILAFLIETFS
jgi:hypothetical protein